MLLLRIHRDQPWSPPPGPGPPARSARRVTAQLRAEPVQQTGGQEGETVGHHLLYSWQERVLLWRETVSNNFISKKLRSEISCITKQRCASPFSLSMLPPGFPLPFFNYHMRGLGAENFFHARAAFPPIYCLSPKGNDQYSALSYCKYEIHGKRF